jgi:hypothetical protein
MGGGGQHFAARSISVPVWQGLRCISASLAIFKLRIVN